MNGIGGGLIPTAPEVGKIGKVTYVSPGVFAAACSFRLLVPFCTRVYAGYVQALYNPW